MKVIYKLDKMFIRVYSSLILVIGAAAFIATGKLIALAVAAGVELLYLHFALKHVRRRRNALKQPFPLEWRNLLGNYSPLYQHLDRDGQERFERDIQLFLSDFTIEGMRRQEIDAYNKLFIAAAFATVLNGRPDWEPPIKDGVLVYPGYTFNRDYKPGTGNFAGMATANSPLIITEGSLQESVANPGDGHNVVIHELAHYFDLEDGRAEGIPAVRLKPGQLERWQELIGNEWERAKQGRSFLWEYAATNEAELFAVAVETFFDNPHLFKSENSELYDAFVDFFNLDPSEILAGYP